MNILTLKEAETANDEWGFNCGPAAICAVTGKSPHEVRPLLGDFYGYMNPTMMFVTLDRADVAYRVARRGVNRASVPLGIGRIQFDGPWMQKGVPVAAQYQHTHWVALRRQDGIDQVFDINALDSGGWVESELWESTIATDLMASHKRRSGVFWFTHVIEIVHATCSSHSIPRVTHRKNRLMSFDEPTQAGSNH